MLAKAREWLLSDSGRLKSLSLIAPMLNSLPVPAQFFGIPMPLYNGDVFLGDFRNCGFYKFIKLIDFLIIVV